MCECISLDKYCFFSLIGFSLVSFIAGYMVAFFDVRKFFEGNK